MEADIALHDRSFVKAPWPGDPGRRPKQGIAGGEDARQSPLVDHHDRAEAALYREHIALEETVVYPASRRYHLLREAAPGK